MAQYLLVVPSSAKPGRDNDYNDWYDNIHIKDLLAIPGVKSAARFEADPRSPAKPDADYLAIYELDVDDPNIVMAELGRRGKSGEMKMTDSLEPSSAKLMIFKKRL